MRTTIRRGASLTLRLGLPLLLAWAASLFEGSPTEAIDGPLVALTWGLIGALLLSVVGGTESSLHRLAHGDKRRNLAAAALLAGSFGTSSEGETSPAYLPFAPAPTVAPTGQTQVEQPVPFAPTASEEESAPTHTVVAGENFWVIARSHLQEVWQRPPSNREVARFWLDLIAVNRTRLRSGDPDLIFPGEVFDLPEPGPGA